MKSKKNMAVIIPCYNEEITIRNVIMDFKKYLPSAKIYVFDNNSTDNTLKKIKLVFQVYGSIDLNRACRASLIFQ